MRRKEYNTSNQTEVAYGWSWKEFYSRYLYRLALQLYEWKGLPDSVSPSFLEQQLLTRGLVALYNDPVRGFVAVSGASNGQLDIYNMPISFNATAPNYSAQFNLYNYLDIEPSDKQDYGVLIRNTEDMASITGYLDLFSDDLAEIKEITMVNLKAQKTPVLLTANDKNKLSITNAYNQVEGNAPAILVDEGFDMQSIQVFQTQAPYVVDKINQHKNAVWNEILTFLGINNANLEKKERMITSEADSNTQQVMMSGNMMLKPRKDACELINRLYGLNVSVDYRESVVAELKSNAKGGDNENGGLHNGTVQDD